MSDLEDAIAPARPSLRRRLRRRVPRRDDPTWLVLGLTLAVFGVALWYLVALYRGYALLGSDFGNYVHVLAATLDGQGLFPVAKYRAGLTSYWGAHFAVTLVAFLPVFALFPSPYTLLVANAALVAAAIPVLWKLARERLGDGLAGLLVVSYAFNPFVWRAVSIPFQESSLLPVLTLWAYYHYSKRRYRSFLAILALVLLTNEFVTLIVAGFLLGLAVLSIRAGDWREKLPVLGTGLGMAVVVKLVSGVVIARYNRYPGIPVLSVAGPLRTYVDGPRATTGGLVSIMASHPDVVRSVLTQNLGEKLLYLALFFAPVVFLALVDLPTLGAFAPFLIYGWLFAGKAGYYSFTGHYPLYLLAFVYIGAVRVLASVDTSRVTVPRGAVALVLAGVLVVAGTGGVSGAVDYRNPPPTDDHTHLLDEAIASIPANASLVTQTNIYPHVATRPHARYVDAPNQLDQREALGKPPIDPEYVVSDTAGASLWSDQLNDSFEGRLGGEYGLYERQDGISVYKRGYDGTPSRISDAPRRYAANEFSVGSGRRDGEAIVGALGANATGTPVWFGPYTTLPGGNYIATYRLSVDGSSASAVELDVTAGENHEVVARKRVGPTDGVTNVTVPFGLDRSRSRVEFRGVTAGGDGTVRLESVSVATRNASGTARAS